MDPSTKGHSIIDLSTKDTGQGPKNSFPIVLIHFEPPKEDKLSIQRTQQLNLYCLQTVLYSKVPLYMYTKPVST